MIMLRLKYARYLVAALSICLSLGIALLNNPTVFAGDIPTFTLSSNSKITAKGGWIDTDLFNSNGQFAGNDSAQLVTDGYLNLGAKEIYFKPISSTVYTTHYTGFLSTTASFRDSDNMTACYIAIEINGSSGTWVGVNIKTNQKTDGCTKSIQDTVGLYTDTKTGINLVQAAVNDTNASFRGIEVPTCIGTTDGTCLTNREKAINQIENLTCNTTTAQGVADCEEKTKMAACLNMSLSVSVSSCIGKDVAKQINDGDLSSITADTTDGQIERTCRTLKSASEQSDCIEKAKAQRDELSAEKKDEADPPAECTGGLLGWIMCPLLGIFNSLNNFMAKEIQNQLTVGPLTSSEAIYTGTHPIWQMMVGIANLLLIIGFLIVIFSQATSVGLSAYGIKKMLPRIIAAAILINLSYFICQIALDIVNIIGASVQGIINVGISQINTKSGFQTDFGDILTTLGGVALGTYAVISGAVAFLVPLGLSAVLATLTIFLGLALRKLVIILLIIIAPLAFAAMILPGTEGLFKKWYKSFGGLLFMYPIIMAILYGSVLLSKIILASGGVTTLEGDIDTSGTGNINIMLAYAVVGLGPAVGTYMFIKNSSKISGALAGAVSKAGAGLKKRTNEWAKERQQNSRFTQARQWNKAVRDANRVARFGKTTGIQGGLNKLNSYAAGAGFSDPRKWGENAGKYQASSINKAAIYEDKLFKDDKENANAEFARNGIQGPLMVAHARSGRVAKSDGQGGFTYGRKLTEAEHSAAVEWTMANGKLAERMAVYGSDWAAKGRTEENRRALDTLNDGYFHVNKDVARFGNTFGGKLGSGSVGGDMGVNNAVLANMAAGKTASEALLDNDMAQRVADIGSLSDAALVQHVTSTQALSDTAAGLGLSPTEFVAKFRQNATTVTNTILRNKDYRGRVKPEFAGAINEVASGTYDPQRTARATSDSTRRTQRAQSLAASGAQEPINIDSKLTTIGG